MAKMRMPALKAGKEIHGLLLVLLLVLFVLPVTAQQPDISSFITGKVVDKTTGDGIEKVFVRFRHGGGTVYTETDKDGKFKFSKVHPGEVEIQYAPRPPYPIPLTNKPWDKFSVKKGKNLYIHKELECGAILYGKVLKKNTGELLELEALAIEYHIPFAVEVYNEGEFQVTQLEPGLHTLFFFVSGYGFREIHDVEIKAGENKEMNFYLDPDAATKVMGRISCLETGEPLKNARFFLTGIEKNGFQTFSYTNERGEFVINDVEEGDYLLFISGISPDLPQTGESVFSVEERIIVRNGESVRKDLKVDCNLNFLRKGG